MRQGPWPAIRSKGSSAIRRASTRSAKPWRRCCRGSQSFARSGSSLTAPGPTGNAMSSLNFRPIPNAAERIMSAVTALNPAGKTPLVEAVKQAAEVLDYRTEKGVIVLLTDGEETCGGAPCDLGKLLKANSRGLTVHAIGYQLRGF